MQRISATCLLLSVLPLLAEEAAIDSYEDLPDYFPQHYRRLADMPEQYHDGEKLTGCFILDSVRSFRPRVSCGPVVPNLNLRVIAISAVPSEGHREPDPPKEEIICHNPFYWDEHGRIKHFFCDGDPSAKPPLGLPLGFDPREAQSTTCDGCLSEEQVLDVFRVYHSGLGIKPLGYRVSIVRCYPWNGIRHPDFCDKYDPNYLDSLHPDPRDPHPNERVNMRCIRRPMIGFNEFADGCKDPQNRDLTWRGSFQIGWHEPENRIFNEHNQAQARLAAYALHSQPLHSRTNWQDR